MSSMLKRNSLPESPAIIQRVQILVKVAKYLWLFTGGDVVTFVIPNTIFGTCCALAGPPLVSGDHITPEKILLRIPAVVLFNWSNLLVFDLANQRLWESVTEDRLNKPWRPIPQKLMTRKECSQSIIWLLNVGAETACLLTATWVYNDLKGSDDGWVQRNFMIALAFWVYNLSSMKVAIGGGGLSTAAVTSTGKTWITVISVVIMSTNHIQDLKDILGDKSRGRETAPLLLGEHVTRQILAVPLVLWGPICAIYWGECLSALPAIIVGIYLGWRCLLRRGKEEDRWTWQVWCTWTALLSLMPLGKQQLLLLH